MSVVNSHQNRNDADAISHGKRDFETFSLEEKQRFFFQTNS